MANVKEVVLWSPEKNSLYNDRLGKEHVHVFDLTQALYVFFKRLMTTGVLVSIDSGTTINLANVVARVIEYRYDVASKSHMVKLQCVENMPFSCLFDICDFITKISVTDSTITDIGLYGMAADLPYH